MDELDKFLNPDDGKYHFRLTWPDTGCSQVMDWKQSSSFLTGSESVSGYENVASTTSTQSWGGLALEDVDGNNVAMGSIGTTSWFYGEPLRTPSRQR